MSFKLMKKLSLWQFVISIFVLVFLIIFVTLLAIKVNYVHKYRTEGYIFLGLFGLVFVVNTIITTIICLKINQIEKHSQIKFDGWFYLIGGCIFCWLSYLNQRTIFKLNQELIKDKSINQEVLSE